MSVAVNSGERYFQWTIDCHGNCAVPFGFHVVDAQGSEQELTKGGFWSRHFWIRPGTVPSSTSSTASTTSTLSTNNTPPWSPTSASTTPTLSTMSTKTTPIPGQSPSKASTSSDDSSNGSHSVSIGVGVGVGVGVAVLAVGGFFLWRRYRKRTNETSYPQQQPDFTHSSGGWHDQGPAHEKFTSGFGPVEMGPRDPVEAYAGGATPSVGTYASQYHQSPQELPVRSP